MNLKIIDNFLDKDFFDKLNKECLGDNFPWYFLDHKVFKNDGEFQHTHIFYHHYKINSEYFFLIEPFLNLLKVKSLVKVKLNFTPKDVVLKQFKFHVDNNFDCNNCNTSIFYLNTNNGKTIFENGEEVDSVENRLVTFNSNIKHAGTSTTDKPYRMVLNFNYF